MSSLVGMAGESRVSFFESSERNFVELKGTAITQIGVGIGVNASPLRKTMIGNDPNVSLEKSNEDFRLNVEKSRSLMDRRTTNENGEDENSNSFESHSDPDQKNVQEKSTKFSSNLNTRCATSVNWTGDRRSPFNTIISNRSQCLNQDKTSSPKTPMNLNVFSQKLKTNFKSLPKKNATLNLDEEFVPSKKSSAPQPRPETLAILSEEDFNERIQLRQSTLPNKEEIPRKKIEEQQSPLSIKQILNNLEQIPEEKRRFFAAETHLDIPFIDETEFEDLGEFYRAMTNDSFNFPFRLHFASSMCDERSFRGKFRRGDNRLQISELRQDRNPMSIVVDESAENSSSKSNPRNLRRRTRRPTNSTRVGNVRQCRFDHLRTRSFESIF